MKCLPMDIKQQTINQSIFILHLILFCFLGSRDVVPEDFDLQQIVAEQGGTLEDLKFKVIIK
jgi:hypothetical protein